MNDYDLKTTEGINEFILKELSHVKGLISNIYRKNVTVYRFAGYDLEDLLQESYIWLNEKLKKEDKTDKEYLKKSVTIYIQRKMSNVLRNSITHSNKMYYVNDNSYEVIFSTLKDKVSFTELSSKLKIKELKHLCSSLEFEILKKVIVEKKTVREIANEFTEKGQKMSYVWVHKVFKNAIHKLRNEIDKIF